MIGNPFVPPRAIDRLNDAHREIIADIRARIEQVGHYQGMATDPPAAETVARACLIANQPRMSWINVYDRDLILAAFVEACEPDEIPTPSLAVTLNDMLPTADVLDILAGLEVG